jgi:hypothetical protein
VLIMAHVRWALLNKLLIMYWHMQDLWGPLNFVALCATELDDTLPRLWMFRRDSVWATHRLSAEAFAWKMTLGLGQTWSDSLITS